MKEQLTNDVLASLLRAYRDNPSKRNGKRLGRAFGILVSQTVLALSVGDFPRHVLRSKVQRRCALACFDRVDSFDPQKGTAFCYFCTIILNQMRKAYREYEKRLGLELSYGSFLCGDDRKNDTTLGVSCHD